ncbi:hypothetical protein ACEWY4_003416 [Coilia grayii]|uniref:PH domain-containing protein n=1 Tax=Coilia grayii TaxID=363190 RepID=A0ABD1KR70_9TELE
MYKLCRVSTEIKMSSIFCPFTTGDKLTEVDSTSQTIVQPAVDEAPHHEVIVPRQKSPLLSTLPSLGSGCPGQDPQTSLSVPASLLRASLSQPGSSEANANGHTDVHTETFLSSVPASPICASSPRTRRGERRGQGEPSSGPEKSDTPGQGALWRGEAGVPEEGSTISSSRQARTGPQPDSTHKLKSSDVLHIPHLPERRAQSPDHRISESVMTPDLLNFKKGWLMILDKQNEWKKNWFVLSTHNLRYYKDAVAEEASELMGEIDLTTCHQVTDHQVQRNYGFQIHTQTLVHTLAAMTAGIRRNWIQALAKNVRPSNTPDAMSLSDNLCPFGSSAGALCEPDLTRDSLSPEVSAKMRQAAKRRCGQRRREGGQAKPCGGGGAVAQRDPREVPVEVWAVERRRRRREERRKRYESVMGLVLEPGRQEEEEEETRGGAAVPHRGPLEQEQQQRVQEIEERWQQVEKAAIRQERRVPLYPDTPPRDASDLERLLHNYKRRVEELTAQLTQSSCHEAELNTTLEEQMSSTWDFQLGSSNVHESGDVAVKMDPTLYSSHVSSLTDKYRQTKELLRLEELRRQRMQEQLGFGSSTKLCDGGTDDTQGRITRESGCPELLEHLSFTSSEELRSSAVAQMKQTPGENEAGRDHVGLEAERGLVEEVMSLTRQNEALNQRNQEMVHQLTEADREIERLRLELELCKRQDGRPHLSDLEEPLSTRVECLESELREKCAELQEAQAQLTAQTEKLMETLTQLQLSEDTLEDLRCQECTKADHSPRHFQQASEVQLEEDRLVDCGEELCVVEAQDKKTLEPEMPQCCHRDEVTQSQVLLDAQRSEERETEDEEQAGNGPCPEKEASVHCLVEGLQRRSETLGRLLKLTGETDLPVLLPFVSERQEAGVNRSITTRLRLEEEVWTTLFNLLKSDRTRRRAEADVFDRLTAEVAAAKLEEIKLYLAAHKHFSSSPINSPIVRTAPPACSAQTNNGSVLPESDISRAETAEASGEVSQRTKERILSLCRRLCNDSLWTSLRESIQTKASLLNCTASSLESSAGTELRATAQGLCSLWCRPGDPELLHRQTMGTELLCVYVVSQLEAVQEEGVQTEASLWGGEDTCESCQVLQQANEELHARLTDLESQRSKGHISNDCTSDAAQVKDVDQETMGNHLKGCNSHLIETEGPTELVAHTVRNKAEDFPSEGPDSPSQTEDMAFVNGEPEPADVCPMREDLTDIGSDECDGRTSLQEQHRRDWESLKATCEQGLLAMEGSHQRALAELQLQHRRELALLQQDKERLLAEEAAATQAAIEAMKKAYQRELEKVLQDTHIEISTMGNADVEEILKRHREELSSSREELDVLSQQYSLKCLESAHLAQALEAERRALQQCQRQYQEISARHQELSGGLANADILPSSLSKEAVCPIQREKILYELQIGLRVKRAEVDFLTQEMTSLKEELQAAQRDKRCATERCTDMHTELSVTRARAQRDLEELREHLRLAYKALEASSAEEHLDMLQNY